MAQRLKHLPPMRETRFDPWVGKIPWRRKWQSTPALLPGKPHGQRSIMTLQWTVSCHLLLFSFWCSSYIRLIQKHWGFPGGSEVKRLPAIRETPVRSLGWEDPLEKEMAIHFSTLAWKIPWMEELDRLQSMGLQRAGQDWMTSLSLSFTTLC